MTKEERIAAMSRTVYAWCAARTAAAADAEDLSQEVLLAMLRAAPNLRDERAFYGFMWSVAGNVYKRWLRKRHTETMLTDTMADAVDPFAAMEEGEDICLLRRELMLLTSQCRRATVLYYVQGMKTAEVAAVLGVSVSMVKYLLFKARNTIREGIDMERNYGEQSYHPRRMDLRYWGHGPNHYYGMADTLLRQNILLACYNDALTAEQIALTVGVGLPYMEDDLAQLHEADLLKKEGPRYRTNIIIFTEDYNREVAVLVAPEVQAIAEAVKACVASAEQAVRRIGFTGCGMNEAAFRWQMTALLLYKAVIGEAGSKAAPKLPVDKWGVPCVCWGVEQPAHAAEDPFAFGVCGCGNAAGDLVQCMDFPINGEMVHHALNKQAWANVFLRLARGETALSENDEAIAAELVRLGYVRRKEAGMCVNCPVLTEKQYQALLQEIGPDVQAAAQIALRIREKEIELLCQHVPEQLRPRAADMAYFRLFESAVSLPALRLHAEGYLTPAKTADLLPTTYVVLKDG